MNLEFKNDNVEHVTENRRRLLLAMGKADWPVFTAKQVHSDGVYMVTGHEAQMEEGVEADALITSAPGIFLAVKTADCLPVLVVDPVARVAAAIHAGWRGTVSRVVEKTLSVMKERFNVDAGRCLAALGPCACAECYEVKMDVIEQVEGKLEPGRYIEWVNPAFNGRFDLKAANRDQLIHQGLRPDKIFVSPFCTIHQNERFFSNRVEGKVDPAQVGRMLALVGINP